MASQGTQRRRNASPSSSTKPQPMRATMPFSLSTKRSASPPKGTFLRRPSPASSPVHNEGPLKATRRSSPEIRASPENRRSPTSPSLLSFGSKVERPKSGGQVIRRTSSLDTLSGSYMSSQWPRGETPVSYFPAAMECKETQTQWDETGSTTTVEQPKHQRSASWGSPDVKEKFRQHRQRTKQNSQLYGRQSPIAADHTAITHSPSIPIPMLPKPAVIHGRCSMEGLNSEIQNLVVTDGDDSVFKAPNEQPDGHRAPFPRPNSSDANTQTTGEMLDYHDGNHSNMVDHACQTQSPSTASGESRTPQSAGDRESSSPDAPTGFKYASSPKPNNSYLFGREPPDGAEKVPLHVDDVNEKTQDPLCVSGPDKSKGTIKFSTQSPFHYINPLPSKVRPTTID